MATSTPAQIRPFRPGDRTQVLALAPRLAESAAPWRDPAAVRRAAKNWVQTAIDTASQPGHALYVAIGRPVNRARPASAAGLPGGCIQGLRQREGGAPGVTRPVS